MDPNLWGYMYWFMLHCAGMHWRSKVTLTIDEAAMLKRFLEIMCRLLICPPCSLHCQMYVMRNPPIFATGHDFYKYLIDFHNTVNQKKPDPSVTLTYEEADAKLLEQLQGQTPIQAFNDQMWASVLLTTVRYFPTEKTVATDEEVAAYRQFLSDWIAMVPFSHRVVDGVFTTDDDTMKTVGSCMQSALATLPLDTRESSFSSICALYNVAAPHFGLLPRSTDETRVIFNNFWGDSKHSTDIQRSNKRHNEDQLKMVQMQKELHAMQQLLDRTEAQKLESYKTATIVLSCILGLLIIGLIVLAIVWRRRGWKLIRRQEKELMKTEAV